MPWRACCIPVPLAPSPCILTARPSPSSTTPPPILPLAPPISPMAILPVPSSPPSCKWVSPPTLLVAELWTHPITPRPLSISTTSVLWFSSGHRLPSTQLIASWIAGLWAFARRLKAKRDLERPPPPSRSLRPPRATSSSGQQLTLAQKFTVTMEVPGTAFREVLSRVMPSCLSSYRVRCRSRASPGRVLILPTLKA